MMRLPKFAYRSPRTAKEVVEILTGEGPAATIVAGGTDLYPNMKRRQVEPRTVVSLRRVEGLRGVTINGDVRIGANTSLRTLERDVRLCERLPALTAAVESISTPLLRNMGTIGGNVCLDTRCFYLNQNYEWRRTINHCLKCSGDTCWTAPGGTTCWAVNSSDTVPVLIAMGAQLHLSGPEGPRVINAAEMFDISDGREWLTRRPDELLTAVVIPDQGGAKSTYRKLRRRGSFDFPVLGVAARIEQDGDTVTRADIILNAVGPAPLRCTEAEQVLVGGPLDAGTIAAAAGLAPRAARPLDNTDHMPSWRRKMIGVFVRRALEELADGR